MKFSILFLLSGLLYSVVGYSAGGASTGGGGAYVCRDANQNIKSAHLIDLWEAEHARFLWPVLGMKMIHVEIDDVTPVEKQISAAIARLRSLDSMVADRIEEELKVIRSSINYLPPDVSLTIPDDLKTDYFPTGCPPEGMMRYDGRIAQLDVNKSLFERLATNTDIAASYLHEAIYKLARGNDEKPLVANSIMVRHLVACLFSEECLSAQYFAIPPDSQVSACHLPLADVLKVSNGDFPPGIVTNRKGYNHEPISEEIVITRIGDQKFPAGLRFDKDRDYTFYWLSSFGINRFGKVAWHSADVGRIELEADALGIGLPLRFIEDVPLSCGSVSR